MESIGRIILMPKGEYSSSTTYNHLDWVRYQGKSWVCKQDNVLNITPTEGATWTIIAQDGEGGSGGVSNFADLDDVRFTNLSNNQIPAYNASTQKWRNITIPIRYGYNSSTIQISDTTITESRSEKSIGFTSSNIRTIFSIPESESVSIDWIQRSDIMSVQLLSGSTKIPAIVSGITNIEVTSEMTPSYYMSFDIYASTNDLPQTFNYVKFYVKAPY